MTKKEAYILRSFFSWTGRIKAVHISQTEELKIYEELVSYELLYELFGTNNPYPRDVRAFRLNLKK